MVDMPFVRGEYCEGWGDVVDVALSDRRGTTSREVIERGKGMEGEKGKHMIELTRSHSFWRVEDLLAAKFYSLGIECLHLILLLNTVYSNCEIIQQQLRWFISTRPTSLQTEFCQRRTWPCGVTLGYKNFTKTHGFPANSDVDVSWWG